MADRHVLRAADPEHNRPEQWVDLYDIEDLPYGKRNDFALSLARLAERDTPEEPSVIERIADAPEHPADGDYSDEAISRVVKAANLSTDDLAKMAGFNELCVITWVEAWSYPFDVTVENLRRVPAKAMDRLTELAIPMIRLMNLDFSPDGLGEPANP
jgi:hypothetical protein